MTSLLNPEKEVKGNAIQLQVLVMNEACGPDVSNVITAASTAIRDVNGRLGPAYSLQLIVKNLSELVSRKEKVNSLLRGLNQMSKGVAVLAPGCTEETDLIATIGPLFNASVITYGFSILGSNAWYPHYFSMLPSENRLGQGFAGLIRHFGWKRIVIISQEDGQFPLIATSIIKALGNVEISTVYITTNTDLSKLNFILQDFRIFVINANASTTRTLLCRAQQGNFLYPSYVWIVHAWNTSEITATGADCSSYEMAEIFEGAIGISHYPSVTQTAFNNLPSITEDTVPLYDAIQVIESALNWTSKQLQNNTNSTKQITFFDTFNAGIERTNIRGMTGNISFDDGSLKVDKINVVQYRKGLIVQDVGYIALNNELTYIAPKNITLWPNGTPQDGTPVVIEKYPLLPLMVILYIFATAGIAFTVACLVFSFVFRHKKLIQLTSPTLNYIIGLGAITFYISVYFFFYPEIPKSTLIVFCSVRSWLSTLAFTLTFVTVNLKMWRIYYIFHNPELSQQRRKSMNDWILVAIIAVCVVVDLVVETVVASISSARYTVVTQEAMEYPKTIDEHGITVQFIATTCTSSSEPYWLSILFGYKVLVQVTGVILAFKIRTVQIKDLNDTKETSAIIYITSLLLAIVIIVTLTLGDYQDIDGSAYGFGICTSTTLVIAFTFVPKMIGLYRDPNGDKIFDGVRNGENKNEVSIEAAPVIAALEKRVNELQLQLEGLERSATV
eukprot:Em0019g1032a